MSSPTLNFNFTISTVESASPGAFVTAVFGNPPQGGFSECSGLDLTMTPESYSEGGNNGGALKFLGRASWSNIVLKRGIAPSPDLWQWHQDYLEGKGKRRDGVISLLDDNGETVRSWRFRRGLPVAWSGPAMNATQSQVAVEKIEIAHEGLTQGAASLVDALSNLFG